MGHDGRSCTAILAFFALAILVAALGRAPVAGSPVPDVAEVRVAAAPTAATTTYFVDSR